jgi:protein-S-isoprenylcysteine O-methyltransferase Ste14
MTASPVMRRDRAGPRSCLTARVSWVRSGPVSWAGAHASAGRRSDPRWPRRHERAGGSWRGRPLPAGLDRVIRIAVNVAGAAGAALFAQASLRFYLETHRLIGALFVAEQAWFVAAFLLRKPARAVSRGLGSWLLAFGGTFGGVLFRPTGDHPAWGVTAGLALQLAGLTLCIVSLAALGRSFGFVAADRGVKTRGPYAMVRHPIYAAYLVIQTGYLLQSVSVRNVLVLALATGCNIGRALAEERLLARSPAYRSYRRKVRWRLIPGLW